MVTIPSLIFDVPQYYPRASITFIFKAMGSRERPPPAALALPERGIGVGLWAADFDGPSRSRVEQLPPPSFGVQRLPVHVRHWRCGRLSERLRAAADALQEHDVATPIEVDVAWNPAHEPDHPDLLIPHFSHALVSSPPPLP